jgi:RNA recognition motif-containing protein
MNKKVYVDNLAAAATENELINVFSAYGKVAGVHIAVDRIHRKLRGYSFVTMVTAESVRTASQALNGKAIDACTLAASEAWPHEQKELLCEDPKVLKPGNR